MANKLTCPVCQFKFTPKSPRPGKPVRCPTCGEIHPVSNTGDDEPAEATASARGIKCPGCKRVMPRGVTYCVACNVSLFEAFGEMEKNAPAVERRNEIRGYGNLAAKTIRICLYIVTLRWWKILEEL